MNSSCELCAAYHEPRLVKENEHAFAVICKAPLKQEHVLVLPKEHITSFRDISPHAAQGFLTLLEEIKEIVKRAGKQDVLVVQNTGAHSTEPHIHFHVLPSEGNLRKLISTLEKIPERASCSNEELATYAKNLTS